MVTDLTVDYFELSYEFHTLHHNPVYVDSDQRSCYDPS